MGGGTLATSHPPTHSRTFRLGHAGPAAQQSVAILFAKSTRLRVPTAAEQAAPVDANGAGGRQATAGGAGGRSGREEALFLPQRVDLIVTELVDSG